MSTLSERERVTVLMMRGWGENRRGYKQVVQMFNREFRGENPRLPYFIVFSDEACCQLDGEVNKQIFRYWSGDNPQWMSANKTQHPQKLKSLGCYLQRTIDWSLLYRRELERGEIREHASLTDRPCNSTHRWDSFNLVFFQQDGAPPHYARLAHCQAVEGSHFEHLT
ncbi:hypothetical protein QAD02_016122 [Eretmocerus hayati]|uniref:Uncharacterized protein n=1 Tax=Eretmocerus hayati TaxID=131215 RepID=A0ACC2P9R0_9HYME|nr:hypothetical protein QAD02_016122 [Eretmocerus hayati]